MSPDVSGPFRNAISISGLRRMCARSEDITGDNNATMALAEKYNRKAAKPTVDGNIILDVY